MKILAMGTAVPGAITQKEAAATAVRLLDPDARQARVVQAMFRRAGVEQRHSVLREPDGGLVPLYSERTHADDQGPTTAARMVQYENYAGGLADQAARQALDAVAMAPSAVTDVITVSCTGFVAPGFDVGLIGSLGLSAEVSRLHVGFMGCHGLFNGLAQARRVVQAAPDAVVLVVAVELCSLHFSYGWDGPRIVANALFADGAAAMLVGSAPQAPLPIRAHGSCLLPDSLDAMTWRVGDHGFEMTLSARVPDLVRRVAMPWLRVFLERQGLEIDAVAGWAVHPGGPRILDAVAAGIDLDPDALAVSRAVLSKYGNMSSATVAFVLKEMLGRGVRGPIVCIGFGPGLSIEVLILDAC